MKRCKSCLIEKNYSEYYKQKETKDGYRTYCKQCYCVFQKKWGKGHDKERKKLHRKKQKCSSYNARKLRMYFLMLGRAKRNYGSYRYIQCFINRFTFEQFIESSSYAVIYQNWLESGFKKHLTPSIDRLNPSKHYTVDNIRVCTLRENVSRRGVLKLQADESLTGGTLESTSQSSDRPPSFSSDAE
jgi:hypothetical protein